ncbi:MAG TPA: ATP-binding protein [Opitutaceae bacterium]|jgi:signal transduction histidine kinase
MHSLRVVEALGAAYPWLLWCLKTCAITGDETPGPFPWIQGRGWFFVSLGLIVVSCASYFFPALEYLYELGLAVTYIALFSLSAYELRQIEGIQRIEVQTILMGGIGACFGILVLTSMGRLRHDASLPKYAPVLVLCFYAMTAWAISTRRIFDARHLFLSGMRWLTMTLILSGWLILWQRAVSPMFGQPVVLVSAVATTLALYVVLEGPLRQLFSFGLVRRANLAGNTRRNLLLASREIAELQPLKDELESILLEWSGGAYAELLSPMPGENALVGRSLSLRDPDAMRCLAAELWATPESLARRRHSAERQALLAFMLANRVSAIAVRTGWMSSEILLAVCLGPKRRRQPYTFPECQELLEWTDLSETAIARSMLTLQAKEAEHISTIGIMGASIAHEIRNPLVALSATAELLEEKHQDPEFRRTFSALIDREVARIKTISEQLRRLTPAPEPQLVRVHLATVIEECIELVQARAAKIGTELIFPLHAAEVDALADSGALRQVVLNLLGNALDAVESKGAAGRIHVVVTPTAGGQVHIDVADNGKGVAPEQRKRLFQPFSSDKTHGFGLGLATSAKLMRSQRGSIALLEHEGPGATFRLTLQCPSTAPSLVMS